MAQPGVEVFRALEIEQGNQEGLKRTKGERLDAGLLAGGQRAAAVLEQAEGNAKGFGLAPLLAAFLAAQPKDFAVGDAAGEVVDGDPTHGADLGNGAAGKSPYNNRGIKLSISAAKPRPEGLDVAAEIQLLRLADHNHP